MSKRIEGVLECADFGPAYGGEDYVTLTFRVHKSQGAIPTTASALLRQRYGRSYVAVGGAQNNFRRTTALIS